MPNFDLLLRKSRAARRTFLPSVVRISNSPHLALALYRRTGLARTCKGNRISPVHVARQSSQVYGYPYRLEDGFHRRESGNTKSGRPRKVPLPERSRRVLARAIKIWKY